MLENQAQCIANCLKTQLGSHVLYRGFGMNTVDSPNHPVRRDILIQLSTYYPDVTLSNIAITRADINGNFEYLVETRGN